MRPKVSGLGKLTLKVLRSFFYFLLAIILLLNLFIVLSGRFYLYKGIANTYLVGKTGPGIYDLEVFPHTKIKKGKTISWKEVASNERSELSKKEKKFMGSLGTKAFLVFRGDSLLFEKYFDTHARNTVSNSFSAAKTVVALLVGIAVEEGKIKSLDEPVGNYIHEFASDDKKEITIRHLLQMSSGLDWEESAKNPLSENAESYYGTDLYGLVTRQKLVSKPGRTFIYQSGNSQLLGFVVEKATGRTVSEYTQENIWKKIGAEHEAYWSIDKENGDEKAFCCLYATARDFGRLGKLIMNSGQFGTEQVIPRWYMEEMFNVPAISTEEGITNYRYGLHIWQYNGGDTPIYYCRGIKGQYIISIPSENLVIVRLGMERKDNFTLPEEQKLPMEKRKELEKMVGHPKDFFDYVRIGRRMATETR